MKEDTSLSFLYHILGMHNVPLETEAFKSEVNDFERPRFIHGKLMKLGESFTLWTED